MSWLVVSMIVIFPLSIMVLLAMDLVEPRGAAIPSRSRGKGDDRMTGAAVREANGSRHNVPVTAGEPAGTHHSHRRTV